eukprot:CAMPEP_0119075406 /NCGR_PEP_ID=MMETSP1178-20130426/79981_1 /TAXON_ID=33656 /ORGANISM="unid sp, Strain CCMP2000" /LENGTH=332 /DNA_ID=CAMNT_0007057627 /DNA_START=33 /DNA_END=1031 /DNA_ORIENTATION=-
MKAVLVAAVVALAWAQDDEADGEDKEQKTKRDIVAQYAYCMEDNCYDLLGVKKDAGGLSIKRAYRKLATEWHPDKNPDPRAKELFQKFANAYDVLSNSEMRDNYDYLLDHPYEFPMHFMRFSRASYMPKSDLRSVLFLTVLILSAMQYFFLKSRYEIQIKGIKKSSQYQAELKKLIGSKPGGGGSTKGKAVKGDKAEEAKLAAEATLLKEIAKECKQPHYQDTLAWKLFIAPLEVYYHGQANLSWFMRFTLLRGEYGPAEKAYLTRKALQLRDAEWAEYSEQEQEQLVELELWDKANLAAYLEGEQRGSTKSAKQKREERAAKRRTGKFVMD